MDPSVALTLRCGGYWQPFEAEVLERDLTFIRRVQALATKTKRQHEHERQQRVRTGEAHATGDSNVTEEKDVDEALGGDENRNLPQLQLPVPPHADEKLQVDVVEMVEAMEEEE